MGWIGNVPVPVPRPDSGGLGSVTEWVGDAVLWIEASGILEIPALWLAAGIAVLTGTIALIRRLSRAPTPWSSSCRWRLDKRRGRNAALQRWQCLACGVEAFTSDGKRPKECKRELRDARL